MQHQLDLDQTLFFQMKRSRLNNPTLYSFNFILANHQTCKIHSQITIHQVTSKVFFLFSTKKLTKETEYRNRFVSLYAENTPVESLKPLNYGKYSKAAFKRKSNLSNVGVKILKEIQNK